MSAWNNLVPGSYAAVENGCKCPVMDNAEMPDDKKLSPKICRYRAFLLQLLLALEHQNCALGDDKILFAFVDHFMCPVE